MFQMEEKSKATPKEKPIETSHMPQVHLNTVDDLPSRFKAYPPNSSISYRPYTFGEVKQITGSVNLDTISGLKKILEGIETSFPVNDLTVGDVLYFGLLRKLSTLGSTKVNALWSCSKCGETGSYVAEQENLEFTDIKAEKLPITLDLSIGKRSFKPLTIGQYFEMVARGVEDDPIAKLAMECMGRDYEETYKELFNLTNPDDRELLEKIDEYLFHELKPILIPCTNTECKNKISLELDVGGQVILPFREERQGTLDDRIHFG